MYKRVDKHRIKLYIDSMKLDRLTIAQRFDINSPIWNGGEKKVGLALNRIKRHNEIHFKYRRKSDGELSMPDVYYFDGRLIKGLDYEVMNVKGITLVLIPFRDLEILERV